MFRQINEDVSAIFSGIYFSITQFGSLKRSLKSERRNEVCFQVLILSRSGGREFHHQHSISSCCTWSECLLSPGPHTSTKLMATWISDLFFTAELPLKILPVVLQLYSTQNSESRKRIVTLSLLRVGLLPSRLLSTTEVSEKEWLNYSSCIVVRQVEVTKAKENKVMSSLDHLTNLSRSYTINEISFLEVFAYFISNKRHCSAAHYSDNYFSSWLQLPRLH